MPGLTEGTAVSGELLHRLHSLLYYNWERFGETVFSVLKPGASGIGIALKRLKRKCVRPSRKFWDRIQPTRRLV